jgi:two-component system chemotaxis response regulator CheY
MMPEMDGQQALKAIRALEEARGLLSTAGGAKIVMTTALNDMKNACNALSSSITRILFIAARHH